MHGVKRSLSLGSGTSEPASFGLVDMVKDTVGSSLKSLKSRLDITRTRFEPSTPSQARSTTPSGSPSPMSSRRGSDASGSSTESSKSQSPSPPSPNRRTPSPMTALHAEAIRIYKAPIGSIDLRSPSPPSPPARESTSIGLAPRRTPKQAAPLQECTVM